MERLQVETRIIQILEYIHHPIIPTLKGSLELFSIKELWQVLDFLETGNMNTIHQFLEEKVKEYKNSLWNIKRIHATHKLKTYKKNEEAERLREEKETEEMLTFE